MFIGMSLSLLISYFTSTFKRYLQSVIQLELEVCLLCENLIISIYWIYLTYCDETCLLACPLIGCYGRCDFWQSESQMFSVCAKFHCWLFRGKGQSSRSKLTYWKSSTCNTVWPWFEISWYKQIWCQYHLALHMSAWVNRQKALTMWISSLKSIFFTAFVQHCNKHQSYQNQFKQQELDK